MKQARTFSALGAACVFGALAMACQTLLLRRFLWRFEAAEEGVALFLASWLLWSGLGAAAASARPGRFVTGVLAKAVWLPLLVCAGLYFVQYALLENLRAWAGVPEYQQFPLLHLVCGCLLANAPFCFAAGFVIPSVCRRLADDGVSVSRAFAWEALGAAAGGVALTLLLVRGVAPDPRDEAEWRRYFPAAAERPGRFETGGGTTFYGAHGGTFYALSSRGVSETVPEEGRAVEVALLVLSQRPYAREVALLGEVPLAVGLALEAIRPDLSVVWCPCDPQYGVRLVAAARGCGIATRVRAAAETPQRFLSLGSEGAFDVVVVAPPRAASLEGASWRQEAFAQRVRRVTRRTGAAFFGLDCDAAALTPERGALLDVTVRGLRHAWPESGVFAAGAGGWWIAAQVSGLAYRSEEAAARFALLKRDRYPAQAVAQLYDAERAKGLAVQCPALDPDEPVSLPQTEGVEATLALGLADALRRGYPGLTPGAWLARLRAAEVTRLAGLLLVVLWMLPVAAGGARAAGRRMLAAWGEGQAEAAPVFVLADALGAAAAGLAFVLLVPLAGLVPAVGCFAALACGVAFCAAAGGDHARLTAGLALFAALIALGGQVRDLRAESPGAPGEAAEAAPEAAAPRAPSPERPAELPGVPRRLEVPRIRELMSKGLLATNAASFWE